MCSILAQMFPTRQGGPPERKQIKHVPCAVLSDVCYPRHFIGILFDLFNCLPFSCRYVCIYVCIHTCTYICISGKILLTWIFGSGKSDEKLKAIEFFMSYTTWNSLLKWPLSCKNRFSTHQRNLVLIHPAFIMGVCYMPGPVLWIGTPKDHTPAPAAFTV